jgi:ABC-type branched-subunit amino acid transport system substrate-binding protein
MMMMTLAAEQYPNVTRESLRKALDEIRSFDGIFGTIKFDPATREWEFRLMHGVIQNGVTKVVE